MLDTLLANFPKGSVVAIIGDPATYAGIPCVCPLPSDRSALRAYMRTLHAMARANETSVVVVCAAAKGHTSPSLYTIPLDIGLAADVVLCPQATGAYAVLKNRFGRSGYCVFPTTTIPEPPDLIPESAMTNDDINASSSSLSRRASPGDQVHAALKAAIEVETKGLLWGRSEMFVPYVSDTIWGDGRALLVLQPLNTRPCYYVVRIDSSWRIEGDRDWPEGAPEIWDFIDDIQTELESEFGEACEEDEDEPDEDLPRPWPAFNGGSGCGWDRTEWPSDRGFALDAHPYHDRYDVLSDVRESAIVPRSFPPITARVAAETMLALGAR